MQQQRHCLRLIRETRKMQCAFNVRNGWRKEKEAAFGKKRNFAQRKSAREISLKRRFFRPSATVYAFRLGNIEASASIDTPQKKCSQTMPMVTELKDIATFITTGTPL